MVHTSRWTKKSVTVKSRHFLHFSMMRERSTALRTQRLRWWGWVGGGGGVRIKGRGTRAARPWRTARRRRAPSEGPEEDDHDFEPAGCACGGEVLRREEEVEGDARAEEHVARAEEHASREVVEALQRDHLVHDEHRVEGLARGHGFGGSRVLQRLQNCSRVAFSRCRWKTP